MKGLENLANMEYPGRFIVIGWDPNGLNEIIVYGVTGRSPSSQAREIVENKGIDGLALKTNPTDPEALKKGKKELLIYNCIRTVGPQGEYAFIVSNGAQTDLIHRFYEGISLGHVPNPMETLARAFANPCEEGEIDIAEYEPDEPNYTPRISGIITPEGAALHIVKSAENMSPEKQIFGFPLIPGKGKLIATYTGENKDPLPSFQGLPFDVELPLDVDDELPDSLVELAESFYQALNPDFRVSVTAICYDREADEPIGLDKAYSYHIINRHERGE